MAGWNKKIKASISLDTSFLFWKNREQQNLFVKFTDLQQNYWLIFFSEEHNIFEVEKSSTNNLKMFSKTFYQPIEMVSLVLHFISSWRSLILWSLITENELIWNATLCRHRFLRQFFLSFFHQMHFSQFFQSHISQVL